MKPAWSEAFDPDVLAMVPRLSLVGPITKQWAWGGATGSGIKAAIIDSGIEAGHPDVGGVEGAVVVGTDDEGAATFSEGPHDDLFGHGTACAGIIRRVAPEAELYSVRVLGKKLKGKGTTFAAGLRWAIENEMDVVNLSLSTSNRDYSSLFHDLADLAYFRNVVLVSAVNNVPTTSIPSEYSSVFSVAAHDGVDPLAFDYNPSPPAEFGAPGFDVEVAWRGGGRMKVTGNSFAAAHISGLLALIRSKHGKLTPFQLKTILHAVARNAQGEAEVSD